MSADNNNFDPHRKAAKVMLAIVLVLSVTGYFLGLRQTASTPSSRDLAQIAAHSVEEDAPAPEARGYQRMADFPKPNHDWSNRLENLKTAGNYNLLTTNAPATADERMAATARRLERRAYDGAPPVVPHPIDQHSAASCLACHADGKIIKGRVASKVSHQHYSSCTQCHVPSSGLVAGGTAESGFPPLASNEFSGLETYGSGQRAYHGAPPTIPHPTIMRSDCASCHGISGAVGLKTSHPWRQSCTQCHAPSAELDQRLLRAESPRQDHTYARRDN
jgi:nitrate reductase (cytochrome), electron transfer subunit